MPKTVPSHSTFLIYYTYKITLEFFVDKCCFRSSVGAYREKYRKVYRFSEIKPKKSFPYHISLSLPRHNKLVIEISLTLTSHGEGNGEVGEESLIRP